MTPHDRSKSPQEPAAPPPGSGKFWPVAGLLVLVIAAVVGGGLALSSGCGTPRDQSVPSAAAL